MTSKQTGLYSNDSSKYGCPVDGNGTLISLSKSIGIAKQSSGSQAPDGSIYFTLTDGSGTLQ